jgi:hypothetical protein
MGAGEFFQKPSVPLSSLTAFGKTLISAGSISLDSTGNFKCVYEIFDNHYYVQLIILLTMIIGMTKQ